MSAFVSDDDNMLSILSSPSSQDDSGQKEPIVALLIDDDHDYRETAAVELEHFGIKIIPCATSDEALQCLDQDSGGVDVIVVNWRLRAGPAIELMPRLHDRGADLPVVVLTETSSTIDENTALDRGAVDFVNKARGIPILAKRLRLIGPLHKRQAAFDGREALPCGKLLLRCDIGRAYWDGTDVELTLTEFKIVHLLVTRVNEYLTYRSIYDRVHHAGFVAGSGEGGFRTNVRSSIRRIRNKFLALDREFLAIENYPSFGYRWSRTSPSRAESSRSVC
jgi:two-component system, OmpR family, response regulator ChvI